MNVTLKNDLLTVVVSTRGAELQSIRSNRSGEEFLWQGDSRYWGRRSPVLFPIVGSVWDGSFRVDGKVYSMSQHGFARDMEFDIVDGEDESEAWFVLDSNDETYAKFPFRFRLFIGYALNGERLQVMWRVENVDDRVMSFQIGAHPAFNYPDFCVSDAVHAYFNMDCGSPMSQVIKERGCFGNGEIMVTTDADGMLPLTHDTFKGDALVFAGGQVHRVSMLDKSHNPYLTVLFSSPVVGLWSPVSGDAPFVCIEPWWGRADAVGYTGEFSERGYMNHLEPGATFRAGYMIIIDKV